MPKLEPFHSVNERKKPPLARAYHNDGSCPSGREIRENDRRVGTGGYRLCPECEKDWRSAT